MKFSRIIPIALLIGGISTLALSCAPKATSTSTTQSQTVDVKRGNLNVSITAVGNLALSQTQDLAFEIPGTVQEVLVKAGDTVKNGQVLATLDTTTWDTTVTQLERAVTTAQRTVTSTQKKLRDAQTAEVTANNTVTSKQFALRSAQLALQTANNTLEDITEIKNVQDKIDNAETALKIAKGVLSGNFSIGMPLTIDNYWTNVMQAAQNELIQLNKDKQALLAGSSLSSDVALDVAKKQLALEQAQFGITQAQLDLQTAQTAVSDAQSAISPAQEDAQTAQVDLKTAQKNLDDAKSNSPQVTAPFAGFITNVNVKGGDDVKKGTVAVTIADPTKFQADVLVNETDISKVTLGGTASVALQAIPGISLAANVTNIAPTATIQSGVVNYKVTVELRSLQPAAPSLRQPSANFTSGNASSGVPFGGGGAFGSGNLTQVQRQSSANFTSGNASSGIPFGRGGAGTGSGNLTQEQIAQIRQQAAARQAGGQASGSGNLTQAQISQAAQQRPQAAAGQAGGQAQTPGQSGRQSQTAAASTANIKLAAGMTVTVSILVDSRTNVVLVPSGAITTKAGQGSVNVVNADNTTANRVIQTGITDRQNTEVTSGLSEGEKVRVTKTTPASSAGSTTTRPTTPVGIPGVGGFGGGGAFGR